MFQSKYERFLEKEVERLQQELKVKNEQIQQLQAALVSRVAPGAYLDHFAPKDPMSEERDKAIKHLMDEAKALNKYTNIIEGPLFDDVDQAIELLGRTLGPPKSSSVHKNSES